MKLTIRGTRNNKGQIVIVTRPVETATIIKGNAPNTEVFSSTPDRQNICTLPCKEIFHVLFHLRPWEVGVQLFISDADDSTEAMLPEQTVSSKDTNLPDGPLVRPDILTIQVNYESL